jgi:hypothetical protein
MHGIEDGVETGRYVQPNSKKIGITCENFRLSIGSMFVNCFVLRGSIVIPWYVPTVRRRKKGTIDSILIERTIFDPLEDSMVVWSISKRTVMFSYSHIWKLICLVYYKYTRLVVRNQSRLWSRSLVGRCTKAMVSGYGNTYSMRLEVWLWIRIVLVVKFPLFSFTRARKEIALFEYWMYLKTSVKGV